MRRNPSSGRAALGGFLTVAGLISVSYSGMFRVIGVLMLVFGFLALFFAFYRLR